MRKTVQLPYKSGWFTIGIPLLIALAVWLGVFLLARLWVEDREVSLCVGMLICYGGLPLGALVAGLVRPWLVRWVLQGSLTLEDTRLRWQIGRGKGEQVDFSQPYWAEVSADYEATRVEFKPSLAVYFQGLTRQEVLRIFPVPDFISELVITPEMGLWGFETTVERPEVRDFALTLLEILWQHRFKNRYFLLYAQFPWERTPRPAFPYIRVISRKNCTPAEEAFLRQLEARRIDHLPSSTVYLTPDYLVGNATSMVKELFLGAEDYAIMPLGYIRADTSPGGDDGTDLLVYGQNEHGAPIKLRFPWYDIVDEGYSEAKIVVRFINAMYRRRMAVGGL